MSSIAPDLPIWAQWFAALAVPIAAVVGVGLGTLNYVLAKHKRADELFDRRMALFRGVLQKLESPEIFEISGIQYKRVNLSYLAAEAEFLFSHEIASHLRKIEEWVGEPRSKYSFEDIVAPFKPYLSAGRRSAP